MPPLAGNTPGCPPRPTPGPNPRAWAMFLGRKALAVRRECAQAAQGTANRGTSQCARPCAAWPRVAVGRGPNLRQLHAGEPWTSLATPPSGSRHGTLLAEPLSPPFPTAQATPSTPTLNPCPASCSRPEAHPAGCSQTTVFVLHTTRKSGESVVIWAHAMLTFRRPPDPGRPSRHHH